MPRLIKSNFATCKSCNVTYERSTENFYLNNLNFLRVHKCKKCYSKGECERIKAKQEKLRNMGKSLELNREKLLLKANTRYFPKGHPMNPIKCASIAG